MHLRERPLRLDNGGRFLPKMRAPRNPVLVRTVDSSGIRPEARMHLHPYLQAIAYIQAMGIRVGGTFCPPKRVLYEVLGKVSAAVSFLNEFIRSKNFEESEELSDQPTLAVYTPPPNSRR
jgi:hypothetical protein